MIRAIDNYKLVNDLLSKNNSVTIPFTEYGRYATLASNDLFDTLRGNKNTNQSTYGRNRTLDARLNPFRVKASITFTNSIANKPADLAQITAIYTSNYTAIHPIDEDRIANIVKDPNSEDFYYAEDVDELRLVKGIDTVATIEYLKKPAEITMAYTISNGRAVYIDTGTVDFEWDKNMEMEITNRILNYAGLSMGSQLVIQTSNINKAQE